MTPAGGTPISDTEEQAIVSFYPVGARTGSNMLAGTVKKLLKDDQMYYDHKGIEFAFQEAVNLDTMAVVHFAICPANKEGPNYW